MILLPVGLRCSKCGRKWIGYARRVTDEPPKGWGHHIWDFPSEDKRCSECLSLAMERSSHKEDWTVSESDAYFAVIEVPG